MRKVIIRRVSIWILSCWALIMLAPLTSSAFEVAVFWYDASQKTLSGSVYSDDPTNVKVRFTHEDTVTSVTYVTYSNKYSLLEQYGYDDNNSIYSNVSFKLEDYSSIPDKVEVTEDGENWIEIPRADHGTSFIYSDGDIILSAYRISASEGLSDVHANMYVPPNTKLISFVPSDDDQNSIVKTNNMNGIHLHLGLFNMLKGNNLEVDDLVLTDNTENRTIPIESIRPELIINGESVPYTASDSTFSMIVKTSEFLVKDHAYTLATSSTASGNEILMPNAGRYSFSFWLGAFVSVEPSDYMPFIYEFVEKQNLHVFKQVEITAAPPPPPRTPITGGFPFIPVTQSNPGELNPDPVREEVGGLKTDTYKPDKRDVDQALEQLPANDPTLTIHAKMSGDAARVVLPAASLQQALSRHSDLTITFDFGNQTYHLPISALNLEEISGQLGADLSDVTLKIVIVKQTGDVAQEIQHAAEQSGSKFLSDALDFKLIAEANGKQTMVNDFGNTYVSRSISLDQEVDKSKVAGVTYDPVKKELRFVPAVVTIKDGKTIVTLRRTGNSVYAVIESNKTFEDISAHWARNDIQLLASKLIVQGVGENIFAPERTMTRAEYTALLVRSLGLTPLIEGKATFDDVAAEDWYYGEVQAAVKAGLISGDGTGNFNPDGKLTRQEAAVLTSSAMKFAGHSESSGQSSAVFNDSAQISDWAVSAVNQLQTLKILSGMPDGNFEPRKTLTRAEAVTILKRLLLAVKLMN